MTNWKTIGADNSVGSGNIYFIAHNLMLPTINNFIVQIHFGILEIYDLTIKTI